MDIGRLLLTANGRDGLAGRGHEAGMKRLEEAMATIFLDSIFLWSLLSNCLTHHPGELVIEPRVSLTMPFNVNNEEICD